MTEMRYPLIFMLAVCLLSGCNLFGKPESLPPQPIAQTEDYRLGIGDVISIRVYGGEDDVTFPRIRLNDRGAMTLPFGDFTAHGKTTRELETSITSELKGQFLLKPRVWVNIEEYRPFFMQGQIGRPGAYPYHPGMTVERAIIIAGGFRDRAAQKGLLMIREQDKTHTKIKVYANTPVGPGDTIIVEESFF